jgi:DNA-3-methyladenine glycosylase II
MAPAPLSQRTLRADLGRLAKSDGAVAAALERFGYPALRRRPPGFEALLRVIVGQQISVAAAASIWRRLEAAIVPLTPAALLAASEPALRACGFSRQKIDYSMSLAGLVESGEVPLDALDALPDEVAVAELVKIKGIGRWTAEIYLLFALGRRDVWPADDLGLIVGMQRLRNLRRRPKRKQMLALAEPWRPFRSAAAHLVWHYFHKTSAAGRDAAPPPSTPTGKRRP